jgi:hypothetical protein
MCKQVDANKSFSYATALTEIGEQSKCEKISNFIKEFYNLFNSPKNES